MKVELRLFATLRKYLPEDYESLTFKLELPDNAIFATMFFHTRKNTYVNVAKFEHF